MNDRRSFLSTLLASLVALFAFTRETAARHLGRRKLTLDGVPAELMKINAEPKEMDFINGWQLNVSERRVYRYVPSLGSNFPGYRWFPIDWREQQVGDHILSIDIRFGSVTGAHEYTVVKAPVIDADGEPVEHSDAASFGFNASELRAAEFAKISKMQYDVFVRGGFPGTAIKID